MTVFFIILSILSGLIYGFLAGNSGYVDEKYIFYISRIFYICLSLAAVRLLTYIIVEKIGSAHKVPSELMRVIISIALYLFFGVLIIKLGFNMNIAALVTTSALLTAIVGLAMQTTLGNVFSGLSLQLEQLFYIGDTVRIKDTLGLIESITWRSVSIRTIEGSLIIVPNGKISSADVEVFHKNQSVLVKTKICTPISYLPQKVRKTIHGVVNSVPNVDKTKPIIINLDSTKPHDRINTYTILCFSKNFLLKFPVKATITERVWYAFARNGIDLLNIERRKSDLHGQYFFEKEKIKSDLSPKHYIKIISNTAILKPLDQEEKVYLADNMEKLIYAHGEPILFETGFKTAMFVIAQGCVKMEYLSDVTEDDPLLTDEDETQEVSNFLWDPEILDNISAKLISFVGPVGKYLVNQAAHKTSDLYRLYTLLAAEVKNKKDKEQFLKNIPDCHIKNLYPEDFFGVVRLFMGITNVAIRYEAVGHVDLIMIKPIIMNEFFDRRPVLPQKFSEILAEYFAEGIEFKTLFKGKDTEADILAKINLFYSL